MEGIMKNQMMYLATWGILKKLFSEGKIDAILVEKLNRRNAETLMCEYLPIG